MTGKCKEDFTDYLLKKDLTNYEYLGLAKGNLSELVYNLHIVDFFDSVSIFINVICIDKKYEDGEIYYFKSNISDSDFICNSVKSRNEAYNNAIVKANSIYNSFY